jgi:hypothetical protein
MAAERRIGGEGPAGQPAIWKVGQFASGMAPELFAIVSSVSRLELILNVRGDYAQKTRESKLGTTGVTSVQPLIRPSK